MSLCTKSGQVACGTLGCRVSSLCCQADIGYGCATGASCFTNAGSIGCWWTSSVMPSGTRPCFPYADAAVGDTCGSASWCQVCSSTEYPFCYTNVILGGQVPLTAVSCDAFTGLTTITASDAPTGVATISDPPTATSTSLSLSRGGGTRVTSPPVITSPPVPVSPVSSAPPAPSPTSSPSLPTGAIAGIAIGAFFAIAVIGLLAFFLYRKQHRPPPPPPPSQPGYADYAPQQNYGVEQVPYGYPSPPVAKPPVEETRYEVPG